MHILVVCFERGHKLEMNFPSSQARLAAKNTIAACMRNKTIWSDSNYTINTEEISYIAVGR